MFNRWRLWLMTLWENYLIPRAFQLAATLSQLVIVRLGWDSNWNYGNCQKKNLIRPLKIMIMIMMILPLKIFRRSCVLVPWWSSVERIHLLSQFRILAHPEELSWASNPGGWRWFWSPCHSVSTSGQQEENLITRPANISFLKIPSKWEDDIPILFQI